MRHLSYNRAAAVAYTRRWALHRNPLYLDFGGIGGDCTNFVSQCIYAGAKVMNYTPDVGWFYRSSNDRTASWTGVEYFYHFLTNNQSVGPYGRLVPLQNIFHGDVIQLGQSNGDFYHTLFVLTKYPTITVAAHSGDALDRPLHTYEYDQLRCIHIEGVRTW